MSQLSKYQLDFSPALEFVQASLVQANTLSYEILNLLIFANGSFFTYLPTGIDDKRLYEFSTGDISKNNNSKKTNNRSLISLVRDELYELILKKIKKQTDLVCVFDDVLRSPTDTYHVDLFHTNSLLYKDEIYYLLDQYSISKKLIRDCFRASNACWHSLCILTRMAIDKPFKDNVSLDVLRDMCLDTEMVIVGAYDGEGYIFWEKI